MTVSVYRPVYCIFNERSMDDVVTVGTYTIGKGGSYERAVQKLESLAYHESMELERTDDGTDGWQRYLEGEIRIDQNRMNVRFFNANSVSLLDNGTCIKPKIQSGASYIPLSIRRGYVYGALKRMKGYGLDPAQMQLQGGRHLLMELRAAGWKGVDAMIKGARPEILDGSVKRILMEEAKRGHGCIE